jgi:nitroreductase
MNEFGRPPLPEAGACSACNADEVERARIGVEIGRILERRSVAVKRLGLPGPNREELGAILSAALAAPDHGALRPWRIVRCTASSRARLADIFVNGKRARHPDSTEVQIEREREKALRPPVLLALIAAPKRDQAKVPEAEQIATAGAALQSLLLAAHGLGYGAIILSGSRCEDLDVRKDLGVSDREILLGFVSIGSIVDEPKLASRPKLPDVVIDFDGDQLSPIDLERD